MVGDVDGALTPEQDRAQGSTPADDLLQLDILQPGQVADTHHAYQRTKRGNALRVTGGDVLIDGGVTASYVYGALQP